MRAIKNPHIKKVQVVYGPDGAGTIYEIEAGKTMLFPEELYVIADHFLATYGFLQEVKTKETKKADSAIKHICQYCQRDCKSKLALEKHEAKCKKEHKDESNVISSKGKMVPREIGKTRSQLENEEFGNSDMKGIASGKPTKEKIGNRIQKVVYDKDGVGWYGDGAKDDIAPTHSMGSRPGKF